MADKETHKVSFPFANFQYSFSGKVFGGLLVGGGSTKSSRSGWLLVVNAAHGCVLRRARRAKLRVKGDIPQEACGLKWPGLAIRKSQHARRGHPPPMG
mmetsp:Transcript_65577/g.154208  ORF Transcript_65577/g.154208 Transcript_65577/m.154208 type:complete len:98 (+) Transcript_65577:1037-1330(+)